MFGMFALFPLSVILQTLNLGAHDGTRAGGNERLGEANAENQRVPLKGRVRGIHTLIATYSDLSGLAGQYTESTKFVNLI